MNITSAHLSAIFAFVCWGIFPIYYKIFSELTAWDLFGHRVIWSFVTLILIMAFRRKLGEITSLFKDTRTRIMLIMSALLISSNWLLYIYAVHVDRVLEASMGYFLNPLINVFMGWLLLKEKIRATQWPAILLALFAMILLAFQTDFEHFPWLALILSITFALYGLIRKLASVGSMEGLSFETSVVIIPVLLYWFFGMNSSPLKAYDLLPGWKFGLLMFSGFVTSLPLILFGYSTKRLTLQTLGFIQYLSPSLKFLCGLLIFHEAITADRFQAFVIIWVALGYYTAESLLYSRKRIERTATVSE